MATPGAFRVGRLRGVAAAFGRRAPAVVLCALATHAAVYRSLWPTGGDHGYLIWYAPLVAGLSGLSIVVLPLVLATVVAGRWDRRPLRTLRSLLTRGCFEPDPVSGSLTLASQALVFLFAQESLERSLELHRVSLAAFPPSTWAILLAVIVCVAGAIAWLGRAVSALVESILRGARASRRHARQARHRPRPAPVVRRSPLAVHGGLRAPPIGV